MMNVAEIREAKKLLDRTLTNIVQEFERQTGTRVFALNANVPYGERDSQVTASIKIEDAPEAVAASA